MKNIFTLLFIFISISTYSQSSTVVISQVYSGGGSASAGVTYKNDYIELHNVSLVTQDISGFSLQYGSATGNFGNTASQIYAFPASTTIPAGAYLLIQLGAAGTAGADLPVTPDLTSSNLSMGAASGKVALVNSAVALGCGATATACTLPSSSIIDLVSWGTANNAEGAAAVGALSISTGAVRKLNGCQDTDNNTADFDVVTNPVPRNSASSVSTCSATGPLLLASPNITGLSTLSGVASAGQSFNLSGTNLTGFPGNITVTASTNFEVSLSSGSGYAASVNVPYTSATLSATPIYVRISAAAALGAVSGTATASGGGATDVAVNVSGNVLSSEPTIQASSIDLSNFVDHGMDIDWINGNGTSRLVVIRPTTSAEVTPADGTNYTANTNVASAGTTGSGNFVVYSGTGTGPITVTGLTAGTNYTVRVYEFNGTAGSNNYNTATAADNPNNGSTTGVSPLLQQINFTSVSTPLYTGSGSTTRTPTMFFAKVSNLAPNTTYRYFTQVAIASDLGTATTGAGNPILIDYTLNPVTYTYTSSPSITTAAAYGKFTTDASGSFTGSFGFVNTGNARFTAGNSVIPNIALAVDGATNIEYRFALNQSITVLQFATTNGANDGTFIQGTSSATPGNLVGLWKSVDGSSFVNNISARPLSMTLSENPAVATGNGGTAWANNFITGYDQTAGSWNTIIPNVNPNGVRLIEQFNISSGAVIGCNSDADGTWPTGSVITADPLGGTTALQISNTDAPLNAGACFDIIPIKLSSFNIQKNNNTVKIYWTTEQEINSKEFVIERSTNGNTWIAIATVPAAGNSNVKLSYTTTDNSPVKGINFYRLRLVDKDYRFDYSVTKSVLFNTAVEVLIAPNPAKDIINIYAGTGNKSIDIILMDISGKAVRKISTAEQHIQFNAASLARGIYYVKVIEEGRVTTSKILLQ